MTAKKERTILKYTKREFEKLLKDKLMSECNITIDAASADQIYRCLAMTVRSSSSPRSWARARSRSTTSAWSSSWAAACARAYSTLA